MSRLKPPSLWYAGIHGINMNQENIICWKVIYVSVVTTIRGIML